MNLKGFFKPTPAPPVFGHGKVVPEEDASFLSRLVFQWLSPFLDVGYSRPLQKDDLWELPDNMTTSSLTDRFEVNFYSRCPPDLQPVSLAHKLPKEPKDEASYDKSLPKAILETFRFKFWLAGVLLLFGSLLQTLTPLVSKELLTWLVECYVWARLTDEQKGLGFISEPKGVGYGIGLGFAIFVMQEASSLFTNHSYQTGMTLGLAIRTTTIGGIFRKSLRLSGRARNKHSVGQITTMISTDATRLNDFSWLAHMLWVSPIQIIIGVGLLIHQLGYSALVGVAVLVFSVPFQGVIALMLFSFRNKVAKVTDARVRLTTEVLQGIRLIKLYAWEAFYNHRITTLREQEIAILRKSAVASSLLIAMMGFVPVIASVLSFVTYGLTGHELNVAVIFTALQFFNVIRGPLIMFPLVLAFLADTMVALRRVSTFLTAEELTTSYTIEEGSPYAVQVDGNFTWEVAKGTDNLNETKETPSKDKKNKDSILPVTVDNKTTESSTSTLDETPFELEDLHLKIARGSFVAIVGRVGSGKSSLLHALIGEMRKLNGEIIFGGSVAYVPQTAWIRNATLRENITFGQPDDSKKFDEISRACSLEPDIKMLPHGDQTEIGEKGINLSGGQKARVSLARAAYSLSDIVLLDDPLSAVDAYVGKSILENCLLNGPLAMRTRILVTHALHVLDKTDYIYVIDNGSIREHGTFETLMKDGIEFSRIMEEYGNQDPNTTKERLIQEKADVAETPEDKALKDTLMQEEERFTGAVTWKTYKEYLKFAGTTLWGPIFFGIIVLNEAAEVGTNLFLGFWTGDKISGFTQGRYMGVYAGLGAAQAVTSFLLNLLFTFASLSAGFRMYRSSLSHVIGSPVSFFDTTPVGRILSRLSKDQDTIDAELSITLSQFLMMFSAMIGTIGLVFYTFPYLGIIFAPLTILYYFVQAYYRSTSVETKRLDSIMRSVLYASYQETLTGLSTIRAYRDQNRCITEAENGLDMQNRAFYVSISIQRWIAIRLDVFGNIVVLGIVLFAAGFRTTVDPSKIGVVLTYTLSITALFAEMINQFAKNEQNMNAVERVLVYTKLPGEGNEETDLVDPQWPAQGNVVFKNVDFAYREGLPLVLKNVTFEINPGEKVGIIGRTGAGKSSLLQALFRIADLQRGRIEIDGVDISNVSLEVLRVRLALVPQDTTMFLGTLRDNLDPHGLRTDAELLSVLQKAWLLPPKGVSDPLAEAKFNLNATVGDEGSNFSIGERQLLALARALVKNSQIIVLDEATSNVDVETDAKVQRTIKTQFASSTLLCIAHRLNTIAYYDRILVMDRGCVAEYDTVMNLFDREESIFRSLCNEAGLQRADLVRIRADHAAL